MATSLARAVRIGMAIAALTVPAACAADDTASTDTDSTDAVSTDTVSTDTVSTDTSSTDTSSTGMVVARDGAELCARMDVDEVESVLGPLLEPPRVDPMAPTCALLGNEGVVYVRELTDAGDSVDTATALYDEDLARIAERAVTVEAIDGLGDAAEAITMSETAFVMLRHGAQVFNVEGDGYDLDRLVAISRVLAG